MLRDRTNDMLLAAPNTAPLQRSPTSKQITQHNRQVTAPSRARPDIHLLRHQRQRANEQHVRIKEAVAKHKLKRVSAVFAAWKGVAHEGHVNLQGAARMLQWRKLLRIWKVLACIFLRFVQLGAEQCCTSEYLPVCMLLLHAMS